MKDTNLQISIHMQGVLAWDLFNGQFEFVMSYELG